MKTYKVKNESGQTWDVDEDKIGEAEKDGFLPVVSNGQQSHRVSVSDLDKAIADGYKPWNDLTNEEDKGFIEDVRDTWNDFHRGVSQGIPGYGLIQKAGNAIGSGIVAMTPGEKRSFSEIYDQNLKADMDEDAKAYERSPVANIAGNIAGGIVTPGIKGSSGIKGVAQRIGGNAALSAVDMGTRGEDLWDGESASEGALFAGGLSAGIEALPYIKKLIPATKGSYEWVNNRTAQVASLIPGTDVNADELANLMKDVEGRRAARNFTPDKQEKVGDLVSQLYKSVDNLTADQVGKYYDNAELHFLNNISTADLDKIDFSTLEKIKGAIEARPKLFGRASNVIEQVDDILRRGGISEIGTDTADMPLNFLKKNLPDKAAKTQAQRILDARRYIDDVTKNVDYDKMLNPEREMILKARDSLNESLNKIPAAESLREADNFFERFTTAKKDALHKLQTPLPSGKHEYTPEKALQFLKSNSAQSHFVDRKLDEFSKLMEEIGSKEPGEVVKFINENIKESLNMMRELESLKKASGGPTSQAVNTAMQLLGVFSTGGKSLIALPITNPSAWMNLVDGADKYLKPLLMKITEAAQKYANANPSTAAKLYYLGKQREKEQD